MSKKLVSWRSLSIAIFAVGFTSVQANSVPYVEPPVISVPGPVIQIESASKASSIIRALEGGARRCNNVAAEKATGCVANALKRASNVSRSKRFGVGKTTSALLNASKQMAALPDDGSAASLANGRAIIRNLSGQIKGIAKTRPPNYRPYQLQVAESVLVLLDPLEKKRS